MPKKQLPAIQKDSKTERENEYSYTELTISFNPYPARVRPKAPKAKGLSKIPKRIK